MGRSGLTGCMGHLGLKFVDRLLMNFGPRKFVVYFSLLFYILVPMLFNNSIGTIHQCLCVYLIFCLDP